MRSLARLLLIWSLAVVVPLKGLAAVTMIGCGPGHHPTVSPSVAPASGGHVASHGAPDEAGANGVDHAVADDADPEEGDSPTGSAGLSQPLKLKCGNCAPCCSAAAPASEFLAPARAELASAALAFVEVRYPGIVPNVPHGPPRLVFA